MTAQVDEAAISAGARRALIASAILTIAVYAVPYGEWLGWPLLLLSTLAHELGHGIAAAMIGGRFDAFVMYPDASGYATVLSDGTRIGTAFISAGGLVGPAIVSAICFAAGRQPKWSRRTLGVVGFALLVAEVLVVRNIFGWVFVGLLATLLIAVAIRNWVPQMVIVFFGVQLALSVFSRADYLFMREAQTAGGTMPSDVAQIATALFLPYWFWGAMCGLFSAFVLLAGLATLLRSSD